MIVFLGGRFPGNDGAQEGKKDLITMSQYGAWFLHEYMAFERKWIFRGCSRYLRHEDTSTDLFGLYTVIQRFPTGEMDQSLSVSQTSTSSI